VHAKEGKEVLYHPHGQDAVLSLGEPRDAAVHFDTYQILQRHRAISLPQHVFLVIGAMVKYHAALPIVSRVVQCITDKLELL